MTVSVPLPLDRRPREGSCGTVNPDCLLDAVQPEFLDGIRVADVVIQVKAGSSSDEDFGGVCERGVGRAIAEAEGSLVDGGFAGVGVDAGECQAADAVLGQAAAGGDRIGEQGLGDGDVIAGGDVELRAAGLDEGIGQAADVGRAGRRGLRVPPSKLMVAVEPVPRAVGKAGRVTSAVPPMLMTAVLVSPAASMVKAFAENVPPVRVSVDATPVVPAARPPMARMPTFAVPPVWLNTFVVLLEVQCPSARSAACCCQRLASRNHSD